MHGILYNFDSWSQVAGSALAVEHERVLDCAVDRTTISMRYNGLGYCLSWPPVVNILTPQREIWGPQAVSRETSRCLLVSRAQDTEASFEAAGSTSKSILELRKRPESQPAECLTLQTGS
jgi:hypothetical protein